MKQQITNHVSQIMSKYRIILQIRISENSEYAGI